MKIAAIYISLILSSSISDASPLEINYRCDQGVTVSTDVIGPKIFFLQIEQSTFAGRYSRLRPPSTLGPNDFLNEEHPEVVVSFVPNLSKTQAQLLLPGLAPLNCVSVFE